MGLEHSSGFLMGLAAKLLSSQLERDGVGAVARLSEILGR